MSTTSRKKPLELPVALPDAAWLAAFRRKIKAWYDRTARDLPWRKTREPYAIWISETMLQQTQVATVIPYYARFLESFPTVGTLAAADESEVLRHWEGLGYYRRARQLHQAAKVIATEHGGRFPKDLDAVRTLPGIGRYTAGAILSFAYDLPYPILEANTIRLFARLLAYRDDPRKAAGQRTLWAMAEALLPRGRAGRFNQSIMELGSQVCGTPTPKCAECPAETLCRARIEGAEGEIPRKTARQTPELRREAAVLVRRKQEVLLVRYAEKVRWAGLWDFPRFELKDGGSAEELRAGVWQRAGVDVRPGRKLTTIRHGVTRYLITLDCYEATPPENGKNASSSTRDPATAEVRWVPVGDLPDYPLSSTGRKLCRFVDDA